MRGLARDGRFAGLWRIAAALDGSVYVLTQGEVVRQITPDRYLKTVAGQGGGNYCGGSFAPPCPPRGSNALQVPLPTVYAIAVSAENALYINDANQQVTWRLTNPLPDLDATKATTFYVASEDGALLHGFDAAGRHLSTRDALTGVALRRFGYDARGRLSTITDASGNVTSVVRDASGTPQELVSPFGQRTQLTLDSGGRLQTLRAPGGETVRFAYDSLGLLQSRLDPGGAEHRFAYDSTGLLFTDRNPDGFTQTLGSALTDTSRTVTITAGSGMTKRVTVEEMAAGGERHVWTDRAGLVTTTTRFAADSAQSLSPDGTLATSMSVADKLVGMQAPQGTSTVRLPSGLTRTVRSTRTTTLAIPNDPLSVQSQVDSVIDNGVVSTATFDAVAHTVTARSAEGRVSVMTLDSLGRAIKVVGGGLAATTVEYDARGQVKQTIDAGRPVRFDYDALGRPEWVTDPLGFRTHMTRDSVGRVLTVQDTAGTVGFSYDSAGHLATITPADRPAHSFRYTPGGLLREYEAPSVSGVTSTITRYRYDSDQQLRAVTRPAGDSITFAYDTAGRPTTVTNADATTSFGFAPLTGALTSVSSSNGGTYTLGYDGSLVTSATLAGGPVSGTVSYAYDTFFRPTGIAVNGDTVTLAYDRDGLLRTAGALAIKRNPINGLADSTTLDAVATAYRYDSTGAIAGATTTANGVVLYDYTLERDRLDRITRRIETVSGVTIDTRSPYSTRSATVLASIR